MSAGACLHHALAIAKTPPETWGAQLACLTITCPSPERCDRPRDCYEHNAIYLRVQYRIARRCTTTGATQWALPITAAPP